MIKQLRSRYGDNYSYIVYDEEAHSALLIDPVAHEQVNQFLTQKNITPNYVVNTHGHGDHTQANQVFRQGKAGRVVAHTKASSSIGKVDKEVKEGDVITVGEIELEVIHTPGHTPGSICLKNSDVLFAGDTVFLAGCGNTKFGGDPFDLFKSIKQKISRLPDHLQFYPGHDYAVRNLEFALQIEPDNQFVSAKLNEVKACQMENKEPYSTLGEEKKYNPFFRYNDERLRNYLDNLSDAPTDKETFYCLRKLRNSW